MPLEPTDPQHQPEGTDCPCPDCRDLPPEPFERVEVFRVLVGSTEDNTIDAMSIEPDSEYVLLRYTSNEGEPRERTLSMDSGVARALAAALDAMADKIEKENA